MLTTDRANELATAPKTIWYTVTWQLVPARRYPRWKLSVPVLQRASPDILVLEGNVGRSNFSFSLLYRNQAIRRYCGQGNHAVPGNGTIMGQHKHYWTEEHEDAMAYSPTDIDPTNPNRAFYDFLKECNIELTGAYTPVMFELGR